MKITFFKNENHLHPRISYIFENAEQVRLKNRRTLRMAFVWIAFGITIALFVWLGVLLWGNALSKARYYLIILLLVVLLLPIHEFCHVLAAFLMRKQVDGIRFYPYKYGFTFTKPGAYVMLDFCALSKVQHIFFTLSPLIFISAASGLCAILFPPLRLLMLVLSISNFATSAFDLAATVQILSVPRGAHSFGGIWLIPTGDQPIVIHRVILSDDKMQILRQKYRFEGNRLIEEKPTPNEQVDVLVEEFRVQFGL